jgi:4-hydroxybenzoate polyprenyltransferase
LKTSFTNAIRPWLELARVSNLPTVWTNTTAAWLIAGGGWAEARLGWIVLGSSLLYTAGMILNDAADAAYDAIHRPERPIPSGRVTLRAAWRVGLILLACGAGMMVGRGGADVGVTAALAAMILAYDCYHKPWAGSVLLMGSCRVLLYLAAASPLVAAGGSVWKSAALVPGLLLGGYIVGLSLVARSEARAAAAGASRPWLPVLLLLGPVVWTLHLARENDRVMPVAVGIGLLMWVGAALRQMRSNPPASIGAAVGRLLAGILWVDAAFLSATHPLAALGFVLLVPVAMIWQRRIAAT